MNIDIIALAKEADFDVSQYDFTGGIRARWSGGYFGCSNVTDELKLFATLLEAEIRKEYEGVIKAYERDIEKAVAESVKAGIGEHSPEAAIATLAYQRDEAMEQNAKLMEALALILPMAKGYAAERWVGSNQKYIEIAEDALTPQPENREGRE